MKTYQLTALLGVRNDVSLERYKPGDLSLGVNIDIDETGKVYRRQGTAVRLAGNMHSLYSNGPTTLVVQNGVLSLVDPVAWSSFPLKTVRGTQLDYATANNLVYWSDGFESGIYAFGGLRQWGVNPPASTPIVVRNGALPEGTYQITTTYVRGDGHESGAPLAESVTVPANSGFTLALVASTNPLVTKQRVYITHTNGEVLFLYAEYPNVAMTADIMDLIDGGPVLRTQFMGPAPAGQRVGYFAGRMWVASGSFLWYSQPYEYELFDLRNGYVGFDADVTTFSEVSDGLYIGTKKAVHFLGGTDPTTFERREVAAYGAILGTEQKLPGHLVGPEGTEGVVQSITTRSGTCLCLEHGVFKNLTGSRYFPASASAGASLLKVRGGTPLLTTTLFKE